MLGNASTVIPPSTTNTQITISTILVKSLSWYYLGVLPPAAARPGALDGELAAGEVAGFLLVLKGESEAVRAERKAAAGAVAGAMAGVIAGGEAEVAEADVRHVRCLRCAAEPAGCLAALPSRAL